MLLFFKQYANLFLILSGVFRSPLYFASVKTQYVTLFGFILWNAVCLKFQYNHDMVVSRLGLNLTITYSPFCSPLLVFYLFPDLFYFYLR